MLGGALTASWGDPHHDEDDVDDPHRDDDDDPHRDEDDPAVVMIKVMMLVIKFRSRVDYSCFKPTPLDKI